MALIDMDGVTTGQALVTGIAPNGLDIEAFASGAGGVAGSYEVTRSPYPVCQTPQLPQFRWGEQFGPGGLEICITGNEGFPFAPVCISYTLYQVQEGCALRQIGPAGRKPGSSRVGCYYATGTAGECGQPGLWVICWQYQKSFGTEPIEKHCYFYVLDAVLWPIPGDTLPRVCKYGWE